MTYQVEYARQFHEQLMELNDSEYERIEHSIDVIANNPGLVRDYDPPYEAAVPPLAFKWYYVPKTYKTIYLTVDEHARTIRCYFLGDVRVDPLRRFAELEPKR